uniref:U3 small nucleolar RNA-associated protein 18 homolog n=1 Tax=Araucaria cunninghamii TaxID=56994 RepID=A0A0D6R0E3_ARACU
MDMDAAPTTIMISQNVPLRHTYPDSSKKRRRPVQKKGQQNGLNFVDKINNNSADEDEGGSDDSEDKKNFGTQARGMGRMARKRKNRREREDKLQMEKDSIEKKRLESLLFGAGHDLTEFGNEFEEDPDEKKHETLAWFTDKSQRGFDRTDEREEEEEEPREPVWSDEEEAQAKVDITQVNRLRKLRKEETEGFISGTDYVSRLRFQHARLNPGTQWANLDKKRAGSYSDSELESELEKELRVRISEGFGNEDDILRSNEELVVRSKEKLLPGLLEYSRLRDANMEDPSNAVVQCVEFHRNAQLLLTAGLDKKLKFFQIDGKRNPKIQSIFIEDLPIHKASFLPDGSQAIIAGRRKYFYSLDVVNGKLDRVLGLIGREEKSLENFEVSPDSSLIAFLGSEGYIMLVSTKTKQLIGTLKMNGSVRAAAFADNGNQLLSSGGDGQVYHWDLRTRRCLHRGVDEGCVKSSALSVSSDSKLFAAGSDSGIVNIYNRDEFLGGVKRPIKSLTNLVTVADNLKFNVDSQILAICSRMKRDSLKLVHLPSCTVFSNWPSPKTPLQYVHSLDFSPGGGLLAAGNAAGKVLLFKLHHYPRP